MSDCDANMSVSSVGLKIVASEIDDSSGNKNMAYYNDCSSNNDVDEDDDNVFIDDDVCNRSLSDDSDNDEDENWNTDTDDDIDDDDVNSSGGSCRMVDDKEENGGKNNSRKNKSNITIKEQNIVLGVHKFLTALKKDIGMELNYKSLMQKYGNVSVTCGNICGMAKSTISKILKNDKCGVTILKTKAQKPDRSRIVCTEAHVTSIRKAVLDFYADKRYPTLAEILKVLQKIPQFPELSRTTLWRWMKTKCDFEYTKIGKKPVFLERSDVKRQREYYLRAIKDYREKGYYIVYQDETWASPDMTLSRCWQLLLKEAELSKFAEYTTDKVLQNVQGYTGGFLVKGGQGRIIINHAGGSDGFLQGDRVEDIFLSKKDSADYHQSMNAEHFNNWFKKAVDCVGDKTVFVLDRAPYHLKKVPSTVMIKMYKSKQEIVDNLILRGILNPEDSTKSMTKKKLIEISEKHPINLKYEVELIAEASGKEIKILWLPVAHCELNPIELVWSAVKGYVAKNNSIGGPKQVLALSKEAVRSITPSLWQKCVSHVIKEEDRMIARDKALSENLVLDEDVGGEPSLPHNGTVTNIVLGENPENEP